MASAAGAKRQQADLMKMITSEYEVEVLENPATISKGCLEFMVRNFRGPKDTPYEGGIYSLYVHLPSEYPFKSPSIGFRTRIFHPNIDERSGSVCLDVINQSWSPMYDLKNIFDVFLPQLLTYGNAADPLNPEAAALMLREPEKFRVRVKEHTAKFAIPLTPGSKAAAAGAGMMATPSPISLGAAAGSGSSSTSGGGGGSGAASGTAGTGSDKSGSAKTDGKMKVDGAKCTADAADEEEDADDGAGSVVSELSDL